MAEILPIEKVRELITDEHALQNLHHQHAGLLESDALHRANIARLEGRIGDLSNEVAAQKRQIQALMSENAELKIALEEKK